MSRYLLKWFTLEICIIRGTLNEKLYYEKWNPSLQYISVCSSWNKNKSLFLCYQLIVKYENKLVFSQLKIIICFGLLINSWLIDSWYFIYLEILILITVLIYVRIKLDICLSYYIVRLTHDHDCHYKW